MANVRKRKTKTRVSRKIPALIAVNMPFVNLARTKERQVWIYEKHCIAGSASGPIDHPAVRSLTFFESPTDRGCLQVRAVKSRVVHKSLLVVVVSNKGKWIPRLHLRQETGLRLRIAKE